MLTQEIKDKAARLQDEGKWFKLLLLLIEFGSELIKYLRERKKEKQDGTTKESTPNG